MNKNTKKLLISAILSAASVAVMYIGCMTPLDYTAIAMAAIAVVLAVIELNGKYPILIYVVTSILSLLILPNKSSALLYAMFFGFYPILKAVFERFHPIVAWILKFSLFNTCLLLLITIISRVLFIEDTGLVMKVPVIILGNIAFLLCDIAFSQLITLYIVKLRAKLKLKNYFE
jgi:hypothetical protein